MKLQCLLVIVLISRVVTELVGGEVSTNDQSFILRTATLEVQGEAAINLVQKRENAGAFYFLAVQATETTNLSSNVRFALAASANKAYGQYIRAIPRSSPDLVGFATSSEVSNALFLLENSLKMLAQIPAPRASLNVSPPIWTPGPAASGMDPKSIKDPNARAEYERRIAANERAAEELRNRARLRGAIDSLRNAVKWVVRDLAPEGKAEAVKAAVAASQLPADVKAEILGKSETRPK